MFIDLGKSLVRKKNNGVINLPIFTKIYVYTRKHVNEEGKFEVKRYLSSGHRRCKRKCGMSVAVVGYA
jgi:hypothetical protein